MEKCSSCGAETNLAHEKCPACGQYLGAPNVRRASQPEMIAQLEQRYSEARERGQARGVGAQLDELEAAAARTSCVVSTSIEMLRNLLDRENALYSSYHLQVRAQVRQAASPQNDSMRGAIDASMYGEAGDQITYCALSLDGKGLPSYGKCFIRLRNVAVENRSTILEENSYRFLTERSLIGHPIPPGFLARWSDRGKLAIAKLADSVTAITPPFDFAGMILHQGATREDDRFLEVHLFGPFNGDAIESASAIIKKKDKVEKALAAWIKEKLGATGKEWTTSEN